ncbi:MAG TPA: Uma2 family endonuclease [Pirellulales bacterium]
MGETPVHFRDISDLREILDARFSDDEQVYVAANMFVYYVPGNQLKHVSPDLFLVRGIDKTKPRRRYLLWEEGKGPDLVIELTSKSTREEDVDKKWLYRDFLGVKEYVMFDPFAEYLDPQLQGFLLQQGDDALMPVVSGRLVSQVLGLHLEADGEELRLYDPLTGQWLRTPREERAYAAETTAKLNQAASERDQATSERDQATSERDRALADNGRLEQELAQLRRRLADMGDK